MHVKVCTIIAEGLVLRCADGATDTREFWMPWDEWSDDEEANSRAFEDTCVGEEIDVVFADAPDDAFGRAMVSQRLFALKDVDATWLHQPRIMTVESITKALIRGHVGTVPAIMRQALYSHYREARGLPAEFKDHAVLGKGDKIGGVVTALQTPYSAIELDPGQYLDLRRNEIDGELASTATPKDSSQLFPLRDPPRVSATFAASISPLLLLENTTALRDSLASFLKSLNIEVLAASDIISARQHLATRPIAFAVIDANLNEAEDDKAGIAFIRELKPALDSPVLLISGEAMVEKQTLGHDVFLSGLLEKPFSIREFLSHLKTATTSPKRSMTDWIGIERVIEMAPQTPSCKRLAPATTRRPQEQLTDALQELATLRTGAVIHLFKVHPRSFRAESVAHVGEGLKWKELHGKVEKSRIKDVAMAEVPIWETSSAHPGLHYWTLQMMPYESFYGIPINLPESPYRYALVAFFRVHSGFGPDFHLHVRLCAEKLGRILECEQLQRSAESEAFFRITGMSLGCVAHELYSDLLGISTSAEEINTLLSDGDKIAARAPAIKQRACALSRTVEGTIEKTKAIRGPQMKAEEVTVLSCLRRAVIGCRAMKSEVLDSPGDVQVDLPEPSFPQDAKVHTTPAALTISFFNILLNSLQQVPATRWLRQKGRIWCTWEKRDDDAGFEWLHVYVHDTAQGIHAQDMDQIFRPGYTTKPGGTGLGLGICRSLLSRISVKGRQAAIHFPQSVIWNGSRCLIKLPIAT